MAVPSSFGAGLPGGRVPAGLTQGGAHNALRGNATLHASAIYSEGPRPCAWRSPSVPTLPWRYRPVCGRKHGLLTALSSSCQFYIREGESSSRF
jgi:hypothetical protein